MWLKHWRCVSFHMLRACRKIPHECPNVFMGRILYSNAYAVRIRIIVAFGIKNSGNIPFSWFHPQMFMRGIPRPLHGFPVRKRLEIVPGKFLGIVGQVPSNSESHRLHVDIVRFCFVHLRCILQIPLKWLVYFLRSWTSTGYISNSTGSSATNRRFFADIGWNAYRNSGTQIWGAGVFR